MRSLRDSTTAENLLTAFRDKTFDQVRYTNFANVATEERYIQITKLFNMMARCVNEHAKVIARFLLCSGYASNEICSLTQRPIYVRNTIANLETAARNETDNATIIYPRYSKIAFDERYMEVSVLLSMIVRADKNFGELCANYAQMLTNGTFFTKATPQKWVCNRCGFVYNGYTAPELCPLCNMDQRYYQIQCEL